MTPFHGYWPPFPFWLYDPKYPVYSGYGDEQLDPYGGGPPSHGGGPPSYGGGPPIYGAKPPAPWVSSVSRIVKIIR